MPALEDLPVEERQKLFRSRAAKRWVTKAFVARKLRALVMGVTWEKITWSRVKQQKFMAKKKREMRVLTDRIFRKNSADSWSYMIRHKLATHRILAQKVVAWERVVRRAPNHDECALSEPEVRALLAPFRPAGGWSLRVEEHLHEECQCAAACSWSFLW